MNMEDKDQFDYSLELEGEVYLVEKKNNEVYTRTQLDKEKLLKVMLKYILEGSILLNTK